MASRRGFILGLGAALAAPAVVRAESLMKIAVLRKSLNEATLREMLEQMVNYQMQRLDWKLYHLGFRVVLTEIGSDGVRVEDIPPEEFYGQA